MFKELVGENPTALQLAFTFGLAAIAVLLVYLARPFEWQTVVLMVMAADIAGGVVSNAARSTRAHWASFPAWAPAAFVVVHLIEIPIIWWLSGGGALLWAFACAMIAKIGIFLLGQDEYRWQTHDTPPSAEIAT